MLVLPEFKYKEVKFFTTLHSNPLPLFGSFPIYTLILQVYPLAPQSLNYLILYLWALPGVYCLNSNLPRNGTIVSSTAIVFSGFMTFWKLETTLFIKF